MKKFFSRKFLSPVIFAILSIFNRKWDLGLNETDLITIGGVFATFVAGETLIDIKRKG